MPSVSAPPLSPDLIAPCGMNCGLCRAFLRKKNPCHGCNDAGQNRPPTRANCRLRLCRERRGRFCYDCPGFPCAQLKRLDHRYRTRYGMSEIENLVEVRDRGMEAFLWNERGRWVTDEGVLCVHDRRRYGPRGDGRGPVP